MGQSDYAAVVLEVEEEVGEQRLEEMMRHSAQQKVCTIGIVGLLLPGVLWSSFWATALGYYATVMSIHRCQKCLCVCSWLVRWMHSGYLRLATWKIEISTQTTTMVFVESTFEEERTTTTDCTLNPIPW